MIFLQLPSPADTAQAIYNTMQHSAAAIAAALCCIVLYIACEIGRAHV